MVVRLASGMGPRPGLMVAIWERAEYLKERGENCSVSKSLSMIVRTNSLQLNCEMSHSDSQQDFLDSEQKRQKCSWICAFACVWSWHMAHTVSIKTNTTWDWERLAGWVSCWTILYTYARNTYTYSYRYASVYMYYCTYICTSRNIRAYIVTYVSICIP